MITKMITKIKNDIAFIQNLIKAELILNKTVDEFIIKRDKSKRATTAMMYNNKVKVIFDSVLSSISKIPVEDRSEVLKDIEKTIYSKQKEYNINGYAKSLLGEARYKKYLWRQSKQTLVKL